MFKKLIAITLLSAPLSAFGFTSIKWTWTAPTSGASVASYRLYQTSGPCSAAALAGTLTLASVQSSFTNIGTGIQSTTFTQATLPSSNPTCTVVTAVSSAGVEGAPSVGFQLDLSAPGQPGTLVGTPQ